MTVCLTDWRAVWRNEWIAKILPGPPNTHRTYQTVQPTDRRTDRHKPSAQHFKINNENIQPTKWEEKRRKNFLVYNFFSSLTLNSRRDLQTDRVTAIHFHLPSTTHSTTQVCCSLSKHIIMLYRVQNKLTFKYEFKLKY